MNVDVTFSFEVFVEAKGGCMAKPSYPTDDKPPLLPLAPDDAWLYKMLSLEPRAGVLATLALA